MYRNQPVGESHTAIHPATHMGKAAFAVADLERSINFYTTIIGMVVLERNGNTAMMGVGSTPLLELRGIPDAQRQPARSTGLYHMAILLPSRQDLGRTVLHLARTQYPIQGASNHLVSEAVYLADPDGNGLEIYRDLPRDQWGWDGSTVRMDTLPLDMDAVIALVDDPNAPFTGLPDGTVIGHMHLRVGDIAQAEAFYHAVLGFDIVFRMPSALFISAGGYHHHIGLNTWHSLGAPPPPENTVGLCYFTIVLPDADAQQQVIERLRQADIAYEVSDTQVQVDDPWGNRIYITLASRI